MTSATDTKLKFGLWGIVSGAIVAIIVGFVWGGWTTSSTTQKMSEEAVLKSRAEICIAQFMSSPNQKVRIKEFQETSGYQKSELIEKGGWDRMPGEETSTWGVASACVEGLEARLKAGV